MIFMTVKLETETIRLMALFEDVTRVPATDCILMEDGVTFLVNPGKVGLAVGKDGVLVKELSRMLKKPVRVLGDFGTAEEFIRHAIPTVQDIQLSEGSAVITVPAQEKTRVIGRNGNNIKIIKEILNRHFNIKAVKLR